MKKNQRANEVEENKKLCALNTSQKGCNHKNIKKGIILDMYAQVVFIKMYKIVLPPSILALVIRKMQYIGYHVPNDKMR